MKLVSSEDLVIGKCYLSYYTKMLKEISIGEYLGLNSSNTETTSYLYLFKFLDGWFQSNRCDKLFNSQVHEGCRACNQVAFSKHAVFFELTDDEVCSIVSEQI